MLIQFLSLFKINIKPNLKIKLSFHQYIFGSTILFLYFLVILFEYLNIRIPGIYGYLLSNRLQVFVIL